MFLVFFGSHFQKTNNKRVSRFWALNRRYSRSDIIHHSHETKIRETEQTAIKPLSKAILTATAYLIMDVIMHYCGMRTYSNL